MARFMLTTIVILQFISNLLVQASIKVNVKRTLSNYSLNFTHDQNSTRSGLEQVHDHLDKIALKNYVNRQLDGNKTQLTDLMSTSHKFL